MKKRIALILIFASGPFLAPLLLRADVHAVVESTRIYRDLSQKSVSDYWIAPGRLCRLTETSIWLTRKDLGLQWMINRRDKTYLEEKIVPPAPAAAAPKEDVHTLGYDFGIGRVAWDYRPTGEKKEINGIECERVTARGEADFAELTVSVWLAPASTPGGAELLAMITDALKADSRRAPIAELLGKLGGRVPLEREDLIDAPISPLTRYLSRVTKLEQAAAPAGIYDLPQGLTKVDPNAPSAAPARPAYELPAAVMTEIKRLEEVYRVLDFTAAKVWPGWANYKDVPIQLGFENGLSVLIGHPNPPQGYEPLPGVTAAGRKIFIDRRKLNALELKQPLSSGGGIVPFGEAGGMPVQIVDMKYSKVTVSPGSQDKPVRSENHILILVHELFHCFQPDVFKNEYGNLDYNPDASYALYSAIEGLALDKAYRAADEDAARAFLKDFLLARELKHKSMTPEQQKEESSDDLREGTAVYSEVRTLEILREGYRPVLTAADDPDFGGFKDIAGLLADYQGRLKTSTEDVYDSKGKCYNYGCFQALLLQRLAPGWQGAFAKDARFLDEEIAKRMPLTGKDRAGAEKRFASVYGAAALKAKAEKAMSERDAAYKSIAGAKGRTYTISLKEIGQFAGTLAGEKKAFRLGLISVYPEGVGKMAFDDVEIDVRHKPVEIDQIYYLKVVDTNAVKPAKPYDVAFEKQEGSDTYINATVTTPLFTLKAPKVRIEADGERVKIWVLARVKG